MVAFQHWPSGQRYVDKGALVFGRKSRRKKGIIGRLQGARGNAMKDAPRSLSVSVEHWPIAGAFTISRGAKHEAVVVVAIIDEGAHTGRGECVPYARYGESVDEVVRSIEGCAGTIARGLDRGALQ